MASRFCKGFFFPLNQLDMPYEIHWQERIVTGGIMDNQKNEKEIEKESLSLAATTVYKDVLLSYFPKEKTEGIN